MIPWTRARQALLSSTASRSWVKFKKHVDFRPELFLLGIIPESVHRQNVYLILHILTAARIIYAQYWKNEGTPTDQEIIKKILDCAEMDRLTLKIKAKEDTKYYQTWNLSYQWLEGCCID